MADARPELRLERLEASHVPPLQELVCDPLVLQFTPVPDPTPPNQAELMLAAYDGDDTRQAFAALDPDGSFVGLGVVIHLDPIAQQCELGYMVSPQARGRGVASELLRLLTQRAFGELGMQRVVLIINAANAASERVAERNGYTREGLLRSTYVRPGVRADTSIWSRLPSDPVS